MQIDINLIEDKPRSRQLTDMIDNQAEERTPAVRAKYNRDYAYDFKKYKTKRTAFPLQYLFMCVRQGREYIKRPLRLITLLVLPPVFVLLGYLCVRYYHHQETESMLLSPDHYPEKQPILVNNRTIVGDVDTRKWIENLPESEKYFAPTYVNTTGHTSFAEFR